MLKNMSQYPYVTTHFTVKLGLETHLQALEIQNKGNGGAWCNEELLPLNCFEGYRYPNQAVVMRNAISEFVNREEGKVSW